MRPFKDESLLEPPIRTLQPYTCPLNNEKCLFFRLIYIFGVLGRYPTITLHSPDSCWRAIAVPVKCRVGVG